VENILVSALVTVIIGFPLSAYAGIIVARYFRYDEIINSARSLILNLEHEWEYRYLEKKIPDPANPSGETNVFMSKVLASNNASWRLTQINLSLQELGHYKCAMEMEKIGAEIDDLRGEIVAKGAISIDGAAVEVLEYIADWHRRISSMRPSIMKIFRPWPNPKYRAMSCVEVDEATGEIKEVVPKKRRTYFDDIEKIEKGLMEGENERKE
jgi:hypothetical protein